MCARHWAENQNQHDQAAARRQTVRQQGHGDIAAGQTLTHDAGADDHGQEKGGAKPLCD
jgi:hypothetical protein